MFEYAEFNWSEPLATRGIGFSLDTPVSWYTYPLIQLKFTVTANDLVDTEVIGRSSARTMYAVRLAGCSHGQFLAIISDTVNGYVLEDIVRKGSSLDTYQAYTWDYAASIDYRE